MHLLLLSPSVVTARIIRSWLADVLVAAILGFVVVDVVDVVDVVVLAVIRMRWGRRCALLLVFHRRARVSAARSHGGGGDDVAVEVQQTLQPTTRASNKQCHVTCGNLRSVLRLETVPQRYIML